ncbi:hypothetical protein ACFLYA_02015 [Candidatus Dependentiae bacterium]
MGTILSTAPYWAPVMILVANSLYDKYKTNKIDKNVREVKKDVKDLKKDAKDLKKDTADLKKDTKDLKEDTAHLKKDTKDLKSSVSDLKKGTARLHKDAEELKSSVEDFKNDTKEDFTNVEAGIAVVKHDLTIEIEKKKGELEKLIKDTSKEDTEILKKECEVIYTKLRVISNDVEKCAQKDDIEILKEEFVVVRAKIGSLQKKIVDDIKDAAVEQKKVFNEKMKEMDDKQKERFNLFKKFLEKVENGNNGIKKDVTANGQNINKVYEKVVNIEAKMTAFEKFIKQT